MAKPKLGNIGADVKIEKINGKVKKYVVVEETYDVAELQSELIRLQSTIDEPSNDELIELGRSYHPYYNQQDNSARIAEIEELLNG